MKTEFPFQPCSQISHITWPPVANPWACAVFSLLFQFEQSQWQSAQVLRERQRRQLQLTVNYAREHSPLYQRLYRDKGDLSSLSWNTWLTLPVVTRAELQAAGDEWPCKSTPPDHGDILHHFTSGSSGRPLHASSTRLSYLMKLATVLRNHSWARRDTSQKIAFIQETESNEAMPHHDGWQASLNNIIESGASLTISIHADVNEQLAQLQAFQPSYLIAYPSVLLALAQHCLNNNITLPFLRQIGSMGEVLEDRCREMVYEAWQVDIIDAYSAKEVGAIALQCPEHTHLHEQSELVLIEILDAAGNPCKKGETGRVVVSSLHNFASPLLRYDIGDYAIEGAPCACGRGYPVIKKVLGRQRNMLRYPDGSQRWPSISGTGISELYRRQQLPPIAQFQLVQHSVSKLEARLVVSAPFTSQHEQRLCDFLRDQLGAHWDIEFSYLDEIERRGRGKFEDVLSRID